ncbi:MAG: beta-hydroxyacyl-ACP dehydratase [Planctomycetia bacterium]|nr:beta-hydroxyacyl-ACP dehydratase [Planctomycetia bacterium]
MRWIWIDRFIEFNSGKSAKAIKCLSMAEDHYARHFAGYPVMPACFILEGLAQTGGILVGEANAFKEKVVLAKVPRAIFHREMFPGEVLTYETEVLILRPEGASVSAKVTVQGEVTVEAEIFFAHLDQSRSKELFGESNFVFTGEFRHLLERMTRKS